jgi:hypothetical protein
VTHEDAVALLGLPTGYSQDDLRRAYLRLVRVTKPEVDPAGFARLREAFELLKRPVWNGPTFPTAAPAASHVLETPATAHDAPPSGREAPEPPPGAKPPADDGFAPYRERLQGKPPAEQLAIAREALAAHRDSDEARWAVLALLDAVRFDGALPVLVEGAELHPDVFLPELLWRYPSRVPAPLLDEARRRGTFLASILVADAEAEQGREGAALAAFAAALDALDDLGPQARFLALRPIFSLHARAQLPAAKQAFSRLKEKFGDTLDVRSARPELAIAWSIAGELDRQPAGLPLDLRQVAARAAKSGDYANAPYEALYALRGHGSWQVKRWRRALRKEAPTMANVLALNLSEEQVRSHGRIPNVRVVGGIPIFAILYFLIRALAASSSCDADRDRTYVSTPSSPTLSNPLLSITLELAAACDNGPRHPSCDGMARVRNDLGEKSIDCGRVRMDLLRAKTTSLEPPPPKLALAIESLEGYVAIKCP